MKVNNQPAGNKGLGGCKWLLAALIVVLIVLFYKSFLPSTVHFSNDAPLGSMNARYVAMPSAFWSVWQDSNWLGQNNGSFLLPITGGILWILGPVGYAKFDAVLVILLVGCSAGLFFRQMRLAPIAYVLGGLAAALNSGWFSTACWGVATHPAAIAMAFLALAAATGVGGGAVWIRLALAGLAIGMGVVEAADVGAIISVFAAAYIVYHALAGEGALGKRIALGLGRVSLVAAFAIFIAAQTLNVLTGTAIKGVIGAEQTDEAKARRWDWATQWSLPKRETLSLVVPGLFGYRMDTPEGGVYWGGAGRDASWYRYFESGRQGQPPGGFLRYVGGGIYAGVLVVLVAVWAGLQSFRKEGSVFSPVNRRLIWFWLGVLSVTLFMAFGRHAMLYQVFYALPYSSTIRNPAKFIHVTGLALVVLFAFGVHGLSRRYLEIAANGTAVLPDHLRNWWAKVRGFDRNWTIGCALTVGLSLLGWLIYASARKGLIEYLQSVMFDEDMAGAIASSSFRAVGWYLLFLILSVTFVTLVLSGWFAGRRARWAAIFLGLVLVVDLGRANLPWILYWDYKSKYDVDRANPAQSTNPVINFLADKSYEHRVTIFPLKRFIDVSKLPREAAPLIQLGDQLEMLHGIEWSQHHFLYYNIQALDIVQEPRISAEKAAFEGALAFVPVRRWELTNTRYLLAPTAVVDFLNRQIDPNQKRFQSAMQFDIVPKPEYPRPTNYSQLTAAANTNGNCAVVDFTGALPRAKLYTNWRVSTNDPALLKQWTKDLEKHLPLEWSSALTGQTTNDLATLKELSDPLFDPAQTVLLAEPAAFKPDTNQNPGKVEFEKYEPKHFVLRATANAPAVLLLNDRYDAGWKVLVDGKPEKLLRANFIMRAVALQPGEHTIEFKFEPKTGVLYVSVAAIGIGVLLLGVLIVSTRRGSTAANPESK